jgi:hypothetical protein
MLIVKRRAIMAVAERLGKQQKKKARKTLKKVWRMPVLRPIADRADYLVSLTMTILPT